MNRLIRITDTFFNNLKQLVAKGVGGFLVIFVEINFKAERAHNGIVL